jgi:hypothetical protein
VTGFSGDLYIDTSGKLCINASTTSLPPNAAQETGGNLAAILSAIQSPLAGVSESHSAAAESSRVAKNSAGNVISISGSAAAGSYIMLFDLTAAPSNGGVTPKKCWGPMASSGPFSFSWGVGPTLTMATGITVVSSSTGCFTQTLTNANFISVEYQ